MLRKGEFLPWYAIQNNDGSIFALESLAGKYVVCCFFKSAAEPFTRRVLEDIVCQKKHFDGKKIVILLISDDPADIRPQLGELPGLFMSDPLRRVSRAHEVASHDGTRFQPQTIILDPMLRVAEVLPFGGDAERYVPRLLDTLQSFPPLENVDGHAPVILLPNVFEPEFCRTLIQLYERNGGRNYGGFREEGGRTVRVFEPDFRRRHDYYITEPDIQEACGFRLGRALIPEISRAFHFQAERVERHTVACYDASTGGWFKAHRDNRTPVTAYRKFAVTINLNTDEYDGGDLCFPEFGSRLYRCPTGGAIVFSCSLLHEARPVTRGRRFAYLPFLYDTEGYEKYLSASRASEQPPA